jgi:leucyl-tRNA synthetase
MSAITSASATASEMASAPAKKAAGAGSKPEPVSKAAATAAPKSFARRDHLREIEVRIQRQWEDAKLYEANVDLSKPKFFLTFPFPYMNGKLHIGHAFSGTKSEFTARFQRLLGKNVLYPFGFHCTGMPIQAAANKLKDEIAQFGCPPVFPAEEEEADAAPAEEKSAAAEIAAKSKGKKTKLAVKGLTGKTVRQWDILAKMVPVEEIASFADPLKWLEYFPPYGIADLKSFGSAIDWRRSFITTSANPFFDRFIRWQFNRLREGNRIKFGKRASVYSVLDGQVCADHDRASGEGVGPQEYTLVKLLVVQPYPVGSPLNNPSLAGKNVYLAPATLRPETMYGQTNCFVLPEGNYGTFETADGEVLVMSHRAAKGLSYQGGLKAWGESPSLVDVTGQDLLGLPLKAPNAIYETVYTLPLMTISMAKGTGVVTSVPSDAPDDYVALKELKDKPLWREKFGITAEMVEPFEVVPIICIDGYGDKSAEAVCITLDIKSSKDKDKLKQAKDEVYLKGFYEGVMLVGSCTGMKVCDAKPVVRQELISAGHAMPYFEPENTVMSRTGDECIVAMVDQWYLAYGDPEWRDTVINHIHSENFNGYNDRIMEKFDQVLGWLKEWACSRQFGLGTKLPWDDSFVIESLSDSTIYMAYYTIAKYFHSEDNLSGTAGNTYGITPEDMTDEVFSYIFLSKPLPEGYSSKLSKDILNTMQEEFNYWYPMDLRVSANDLIPNHLTMALYNHVEIWKDRPNLWPRGIFCNGHILVDAEKMSKSKGNFLILDETVKEYGADATRFALAVAGDGMDDANFDRSVANQAITYLYNEEEWVRQVTNDKNSGALRTDSELMFMDIAFENEMNYIIEAALKEFTNVCFRDGVTRCWFDYTIARDGYRDWSTRCGIPMHARVITKFIYAMVVMISPVCPHWSENLWSLVNTNAAVGSVVNASWPEYSPYDRLVRKQYSFFQDFMKNVRLANLKSKDTGGSKHAEIYLASGFEPKRVKLLTFMQGLCAADGSFPADLLKVMKNFVEDDTELKPDTKGLMQFGAFMRDEAKERGAEALATEMAFDQQAILQVELLLR